MLFLKLCILFVDLQLDLRVKMDLSVVLGPVVKKLMQMAEPILDRLNEYVYPGFSKGLIEYFSGKLAPG